MWTGLASQDRVFIDLDTFLSFHRTVKGSESTIIEKLATQESTGFILPLHHPRSVAGLEQSPSNSHSYPLSDDRI